ncbi:carbohydrate kinase family protein [Athalassotoga saccharophila]|uniref:carbohydrate kinase family protein n=1 Tax=Athalassotoga saccharophila TaxID=1441386 RepID=UPI00137B1017|nr:carbohydrate kinase [Athalassotoga saccharophila]BBJ28575.1 ATP-dependent 6-phosphofructokinase [Athalassotoga saccharophila]
MGKIVIAGEMLIDMITTDYVDDLGKAETFTRHFGGSPANIAINLADLGIKSKIVSRVGNDPVGHALIDHAKSRNLDTRYIQIDSLRPTTFVIVSKSKSTPQFLALRGAETALEMPPIDIFDDASYFHFSSWPISYKKSRKTIFEMVEYASDKGIKICFDPNYRKVLWENGADGRRTLKSIFKYIFLAKPSNDDAFHIFGSMNEMEYIKAFHRFGVENVVLTLGKDGAIISNGKRSQILSSVAKTVVNTTGAGDAFWSGMYYAMMNGADIFEAAKFGNATAAFRIGCQSPDSPLDKGKIERDFL